MRKGKSIIGLQVTSEGDGVELGTVKDLIFDHDTDEVVGLLVSERELFGLIDAKVVPWNQVRVIGPNAVMVPSRDSVMNAGENVRISNIMERETALSGTKVRTRDGQDLGSFADMYIDENTGRVLGYEVSGGFFSDTMSGKHYLASTPDIFIGEDVALVPSEVATDIESRKSDEPGGIKGAFSTAKDKVTDVYGNIAQASVDKQKEFVVGKTASRDVFLPADQGVTDQANSTPDALPASSTAPAFGTAYSSAGTGMDATSEIGTSELTRTQISEDTTVFSTAHSTDVGATSGTTSSTSPTSMSNAAPQGEILVRQGEVITREHADRAESTGILHQLLIAAGGTMAGGALDAGKEKLGVGAAGAQGNAEEMAIGKPAGREVTAPDGSTIVAPGMIITHEMMDVARGYGKERDVIAAAGLGVASQSADTVKDHAVGIWDTIKGKAAELTGAAQEKKAEYDEQAEQKRINNAIGRPTTRVILDPSDRVILNTGDLITHQAVDQSRQAGVLEILLDSVYTADPEITPEMLRAKEPGEAALPTQAEPTGGPITATVSPDASQPAQDTPAQGTQS
jgi:uncharacterized protein YrrD